MQRDNPAAPARSRSFSAILLVLFAVLQVLIIGVSFMGGFLFYEWRYSLPEFEIPGVNVKEILPDAPLPLLSEAKRILEENAFFPLPEQSKLEYGMIRGMLQAYNEPFTTFVEPPQHELQTNQLEGRFGGIGVRIERDAENYVYLYPLPDSPALTAGVQEGDRLLAVGSLPVIPETTTDEIQAAVRGKVGEKVNVTVGRKPDYKPIEVAIVRAEVALPSVTWNLASEDARVGVVNIHVIADTTPDEVTRAIEDLQSRGATHFVLDVRNNGGGLVEAGVDTARLFLDSGTVIEQQYRGEEVKAYKVERPGPFADLPITVLVNQGTASAAEIFAGAIKGHGRGLIVGTRTYGKDSIQLVFSLSDGSSLHVTAAQWWVPGLEPKIGSNGIQPDVPLPEGTDDAEALLKAIETVLAAGR